MFNKEVIGLSKPCIEAIKKTAKKAGKKWNVWGELAFPDIVVFNKQYASYEGRYQQEKMLWLDLRLPRQVGIYRVPAQDCIPLLHWERIEEILEGMGYKLKIRFTSEKEYFALISKNSEVGGIGKTRQEAVMLAVIELEKEK